MIFDLLLAIVIIVSSLCIGYFITSCEPDGGTIDPFT